MIISSDTSSNEITYSTHSNSSGERSEISEKVSEQFLKVSDALKDVQDRLERNQKKLNNISTKEYKSGLCFKCAKEAKECMLLDGYDLDEEGFGCALLTTCIVGPCCIAGIISCLFCECVCCFLPSKASQKVQREKLERKKFELKIVKYNLKRFELDDVVRFKYNPNLINSLSYESTKQLNFAQLRDLDDDEIRKLIAKGKINTKERTYFTNIFELSNYSCEQIINFIEDPYFQNVFATVDGFLEECILRIPIEFFDRSELQTAIQSVFKDYGIKTEPIDDIHFVIKALQSGKSLFSIFYHDTHFIVDGKSIYGNSEKFSALSLKLEEMIAEAVEGKPIIIDKLSPSDFAKLVNYTETGTLPLSSRNLGRVLKTALYFEIDHLLFRCDDYFERINISRVNPELVMTLAPIAHKRSTCQEFLLNYFRYRLSNLSKKRYLDEFIDCWDLTPAKHNEPFLDLFEEFITSISEEHPFFIKDLWEETSSARDLLIRFCQNPDHRDIIHGAWHVVPVEVSKYLEYR